MSLRGDILARLRAADGWLSGAEMSRRFGISRSAVHKHVQALIAAGHGIDAAPRRGYRLHRLADEPSCEAAGALLHTRTFGRSGWHHVPTVDSTNEWLRGLAAAGAPHGCVAVADTQTAGRGRKGRAWSSPAGAGLYASLLLRPRLALEHVPLIALLAAVAAAEAVRETAKVPALIKWPNDLLLNGRKIAGILAEAASEPDVIEYVVVGLGINVNTPPKQLPARPLFPAGSLLGETGRRHSRATLLAAWLNRMEAWWPDIVAGHPEAMLARWSELAATTGRRVRIAGLHEDIEGVALGVCCDGALRLRDDNGGVQRVFSGDLGFTD